MVKTIRHRRRQAPRGIDRQPLLQLLCREDMGSMQLQGHRGDLRRWSRCD